MKINSGNTYEINKEMFLLHLNPFFFYLCLSLPLFSDWIPSWRSLSSLLALSWLLLAVGTSTVFCCLISLTSSSTERRRKQKLRVIPLTL